MSSTVPSAVLAESGPDAGQPWHYGDPLREQRRLEAGDGAVDLSHRGVLTVSGPDRLSWLHSLTTQHLTDLAPGVGVTTLVLSPQGHIEHALYGVDDGETFWAHTEPGAATAAAAWLDRMRFMMRVEVVDLDARVASQQASAKPTIIAPKAAGSPPCAIARPPTMVPSRMARKVAASTKAFPAGSSSRAKWSGRMPYLIGPNSAAMVPKMPSATNSIGTECR